ncbi:hypothetical protein SODG_003106 [Sodalis praecaptivus]
MDYVEDFMCALPRSGDRLSPVYARDAIPAIHAYPSGQSTPTPSGPLCFRPGALIGSVSGELGLRGYLESHGHELVVTSDKEGWTPFLIATSPTPMS